MARPRKVQRTSTNSRKKENTPTAKTEHNTPSTSSLLSPKGLLDLPAELRNTVYRYVLTSSEPTKLECERIPGRTARYRFTMIPALTLVSKQLRLETRRIFLGSNVFSLTPELFKRQSERPLRAISRMHKDVGLDLKTLQITLEVKKRCDEELYSMTAALTLHVVEDQITVTEQAYRASHIGRRESNWPASYIPHVKVCGCRGQTFAEAFNARPSRSHDLIACVQLLKRSLCRGTVSYLAEDMRRTDEVVLHARYCVQCSESGAGEDYFLF